MERSTHSMSKKQKEELWRPPHPNGPGLAGQLPTYRHVVGIDVVISWMGVDRKSDTRDIICDMKRQRSSWEANVWGELLTRQKKKRSPWWQHRGSVTLWGDTGWHCMCAAIFNPHRCPVSRGTEEVCDVSGRIKDGTQAAGHEPGNALSYGTFPSKPSYKRLSPFYR